MPNIQKQKTVALALARECSAMIRKGFRLNILKEWKDDRTPVTAIDRAVNRRALKRLFEAFPRDTVISEEEDIVRGTSGDVWVVDPIDGTIPFSHGVPTFCFSIALVRNGVPILGIIIDPILEREFIGVRGSGAWCNRKRITMPTKLSARPVLAVERLVGSMFQQKKFRPWAEQFFFMELACITYDAMMVAVGNFAAATYPHDKPWDIAACEVIVTEAGGIVTSLQGKPQRYDQRINGAIIAHPQVYNDILEFVLARNGKDYYYGQ